MHRSVYMLMLTGAVAGMLGLAHPVSAQSVLVLKPSVTDADGRITIGDVFDNAGNAAHVVLGSRVGPTAVLDAGRVQAMARQAGAYWDNPQGLRRIVVSAGSDGSSGTTRTTQAPTTQAPTTQAPTTQAGRTREMLVFSRSMGANEIVGPSDVSYQPVQSHMATGAGLEAADVIGKSVRYPIREGAVVRGSDLSNPVVIRRSEQVRVTWTAGALNLSMSGVAQKDAAVGDVLMVQNPQSKKMVEVVVTGPGTAVIGQTATQLRNQSLYSAR
ncbi:flagellar basal body P-ring formation chaperone FlgA [Asticcacaulis tiandongensis]|uniref:flagellar basal body P-ring formation chaperone FlgA n=1 Tax=Asticcacaulis tiandongensis TaxID=2565365 RepID=UPI00112E1AB3|nr:flagellar basal body P-ring formation chaperone FlgA [Asticcacaulis tiandongensis]